MSKKDEMVKEQPDVAKRLRDLEKAGKEKDEKIKALEKDLDEAAQIISGIGEQRSASDEEERQRLIYSCAKDSKGFQRKDHLAQLSLADLRQIRKGFDHANSIYYLEYFEARRKRALTGKEKSGMTIGEYDPKTKRWKT